MVRKGTFQLLMLHLCVFDSEYLVYGMSTDRNVVPNPKGRWDVRGGGNHASAHTDTQAAVTDRDWQIIGNQGGGELSVRNRQGQVRAKGTIVPGIDTRNVNG